MTEAKRAWPADQVERWPLAKLVPYAKNAKLHNEVQVAAIARSMTKFGVTNPILVDEAGSIIAGHGRVLAAIMLKLDALPVMVARGWTEDEKRAYRIADNRLAELSPWDEQLLAHELAALQPGFDLSLIGYNPDDVAELLTPATDMTEADRSRLLNLVTVTMTEPTHQVVHGEHYVLQDRHHLLCVSVLVEWDRWAPLLTGNALFCPYAGVFVPFSRKAEIHSLVMVQPDPFIAGHILDRFAEVRGPNAAVRRS